jgi:putative ubiquitin-RnfH superfamily antitoxin RatB of RatAB toxin-antitoxin module
VKIRVEVVYALRDAQAIVAVELEGGASAADALAASGLRDTIPGGLPTELDVGIWGVRVAPETELHDGDRVEIYRPLVADPKQARRRRAGLQRAARSRR